MDKPKKKRSNKYEEKLKFEGTFEELIKMAASTKPIKKDSDKDQK